MSLLRKLALFPVSHRDVPQLYPYSRDQNARIFDIILATVNDVCDDERAELEAVQAQEKSRVDATHPPTSYRIAFLELLDPIDPVVNANRYDFDGMATLMQPEADRQGKRLMQLYEVQ